LQYEIHRLVPAPICLLILGCVSNRAIQTVQPNDYAKSCEALQYELQQLGATLENAQDDSDLTAKTMKLALVFWPSVIVNESRSKKKD
jgi:hypothetical protein